MEKMDFNYYERVAQNELKLWQEKMMKKPSIANRFSKGVQNKINKIIPEKIHRTSTAIIREMSKTVLYGSKFTSGKALIGVNLEERETRIRKKIENYKVVGAASGAGIGAGGLLIALADLPVLLSIKMKLLFSIASLYGFNVKEYRERLFILYIFQLAFSSQALRKETYEKILYWEEHQKTLPENINDFNWRTFQQEYRDYIDIAKLLQLIPGIGAFVGAYANHKLINKLGEYAMNAYRLRIKNIQAQLPGSSSYIHPLSLNKDIKSKEV